MPSSSLIQSTKARTDLVRSSLDLVFLFYFSVSISAIYFVFPFSVSLSTITQDLNQLLHSQNDEKRPSSSVN
ncbi:hypothetical protein LguiA_035445 [Lonicera macranthoides]